MNTKYKFRRTYVGGSKQNEIKILNSITDDNSVIEWLKLKINMIEYFNDYLDVIFSWSKFFMVINTLILFLYLFFINILPILLILITTFIIILALMRLHNKVIKEYNFCLSIISSKISQISDLDINKN